MKKILAASAFAILGAVGCASPSDNLCIESATCAGEDDPATFCSDAKADLDEDQQACADTCKSQSDAYATCALENGKCDEKVYTVDPADACEDQSKDFLDCFADC